MRICKCDGKEFGSGKECNKQFIAKDGFKTPDGWISIEGKIYNNHKNAHVVESNGETKDFCSKECLNNFLFQPEES